MSIFTTTVTIPLIIGLGVLCSFLFIFFAITSLREREYQAAHRAIFMAILIPVPFFLLVLVPALNSFVFHSGFLVSLTVLMGVMFIRGPWDSVPSIPEPLNRIDERDTIFSRRDLAKMPDRFEEYYTANPENLKKDEQFRRQPGLLNTDAALHHPLGFPASQAAFDTIDILKQNLDHGSVNPLKSHQDPVQLKNFIRGWMKQMGAVSVGFTELKEYHKYTYIGRGSQYGDPVELPHRHAIAITVEMDKLMMDAAPRTSAVMESSQQYLRSGTLAVTLANFLKNLGYPSRAHIDGSYRVVCPLVAQDAGLGVIGRMGLLMTPELGPRVRIAVVTTDISLPSDPVIQDPSVLAFCRICRKCADTCPGFAIPDGHPADVDGVERWQINSNACFEYWCKSGTDCGRCMSVCPYSHPNTLLHNLVRSGIRRSTAFRHLALWMDDFFYDRKPAPAALPEWIDSQ